jgi:hypothetical protein
MTALSFVFLIGLIDAMLSVSLTLNIIRFTIDITILIISSSLTYYIFEK